LNLKPDRQIQKALISTTAQIGGEYCDEHILLRMVWPEGRDFYTKKTCNRSTIMLVFQTQPVKIGGREIYPSYAEVGEKIASYLSLLFGKRFDFHGFVESNGFFQIPDYFNLGGYFTRSIPINSAKARIDFEIPINLTEFSRIKPFMADETVDIKFLQVFTAITRSYWRALQTFESDPEVSFLHLITAGEIISNFEKFDFDALLEEETRNDLQRIEIECCDGIQIVSRIKGKLRQVKKRFVKAICSFCDDNFFNRTESSPSWGRLRLENFEASIGAAYEVRSSYLHTGSPFGYWVLPHESGCGSIEMNIGTPVTDDPKWSNILANSLSLFGLERVIRYSIIRFAEKHGRSDFSKIVESPNQHDNS